MNMLNMSDVFFVLENTIHNSDTLQLSGCLYKTCYDKLQVKQLWMRKQNCLRIKAGSERWGQLVQFLFLPVTVISWASHLTQFYLLHLHNRYAIIRSLTGMLCGLTVSV